MSKPIQIVISNSVDEILALVNDGFCPVECSIGGRSIIDHLEMDHHGDYSYLESVAIRAYRDHYGARISDPRFVIAGVADADATFACAALAGLLPHPDKQVAATVAPHIAAGLKRDLSDLAGTVAMVDTNPIGLNIPALTGGDVLMVWNAMSQGARDNAAAACAVQLWVNLLTGNQNQLRPYFAAAAGAETERVLLAQEDFEKRSTIVHGIPCLTDSKVFGFDQWYGLDQRSPHTDIRGWSNPVVLALNKNSITVGCPNDNVAEQLFGKGGLKNVFSKLEPAGWGGRESVGGSPRGEAMTEEQMFEAARVIQSCRVG